MKETKIILAIETSCDETACAVVSSEREVLSNAVYSQIEQHKIYGGVVPEIASRNHVVKLPYIIDSAVKEANINLADVSAIAVTYAPGLIGALITGVSYAKALAYAIKKPLIAVNHIEGHICANYLTYPELKPPFLCLVVSGGHTHIVNVIDYGKYELLGATRDDACGEAFDKIARVLNLPYPGGPELEKLALSGDKNKYTYPKGFRGVKDNLDFSFSGLKTAVINHKHKLEQRNEEYILADIAASFQANVIEVLVEKTLLAAKVSGAKKIALAGGVSANKALREAFNAMGKANGYEVYIPDFKYSTDNAAMIAMCAFDKLNKGICAKLDLNAQPYNDIF